MPQVQDKSIDPQVTLPPSVIAASKRADELFQQVNGPAPEPQPEPQPQSELQAQAPEPQPPAPAPEPQAQPEPQPEPAVTSQGNEDQGWERKYNRLRGRYDAANRRLQEMQAQLEGLQTVVAGMQQQQQQAQPEPMPTPSSLLSPEEREQWGEDFLGVVDKKAQEVFSQREKAFKDEIAQLKAQLAGVTGKVEQTAQERFFIDMDREMKEWRTINESEEFLDWLQLQDPYSGVIRHELLKRAVQRGDTARALAFFKGFLAEEAATAPQGPNPNPPAPAPSRVPLETFAAPGRAKSAPPSGPAEKPVITNAFIAKFYTDVRAGKYRGRESEREQIEQQIFAAARQANEGIRR